MKISLNNHQLLHIYTRMHTHIHTYAYTYTVTVTYIIGRNELSHEFFFCNSPRTFGPEGRKVENSIFIHKYTVFTIICTYSSAYTTAQNVCNCYNSVTVHMYVQLYCLSFKSRQLPTALFPSIYSSRSSFTFIFR